MARIELSNIGGGGGTTLSLTTTGTSGAATLAGSVLNIPIYQGALTLTTTGTSGAATLVGNTLNIPQYSGGGGTPAGSAGQVQFNSTPAGSFAASANLAWDNTATQLNIGAPSAPTGKLNVKGGGTTSSTVNLRLTNSGNTELVKVLDNGSTNIGTGFNWDNTNGRLGIGTNSPSNTLIIRSSAPVVSSEVSGFSHSYVNSVYSRPNSNGSWAYWSGLNGGASFWGIGKGSTTPPLAFFGLSDDTSTTISSVVFCGAKRNSSTNETQALSSSERVFSFYNASSGFNLGNLLQTIFGDGSVLISSGTVASAKLHVVGSNTSSGTNAFLVQNSTPSDLYKIENNGKISYWATNTAAGTTGAQTINRPSGTVNFGIGATTLVVTNSLCTTSSLVFATVRTADATAYIKNVVPAAGSFTIELGAAATAETSVGFFIIN